MNNINRIAVDLAKNSFQVHIGRKSGRLVSRKKLNREKFKRFLGTVERSIFYMEACGSSNYWARKAIEYGHTVQLIAPQYVKPYVKRQKNDASDAEAIFEAGCRKNMNFVPIKTVEQQDLQAIHRIRERLVGQRTALTNQIRSFLFENGIAVRQGSCHLRLTLQSILDSSASPDELVDLSGAMINELKNLSGELRDLNERLELYDKKIESMAKEDDRSKRLTGIPGIGPITATALVAAIGNAAEFKNSRQLSAWLGLVPKQNSTGGKTKLVGLSKQGNKTLRTLLIHGGRAVMMNVGKKTDPRSNWACRLRDKVGMNKAAVAMANKNARTVWAILVRGVEYDPNYKGKGSPSVISSPSVATAF